MKTEIKAIKKEFQYWSGFPLEGETIEEMQASIKAVAWNLECEIHQISDSFYSRLSKLEDEK